MKDQIACHLPCYWLLLVVTWIPVVSCVMLYWFVFFLSMQSPFLNPLFLGHHDGFRFGFAERLFSDYPGCDRDCGFCFVQDLRKVHQPYPSSKFFSSRSPILFTSQRLTSSLWLLEASSSSLSRQLVSKINYPRSLFRQRCCSRFGAFYGVELYLSSLLTTPSSSSINIGCRDIQWSTKDIYGKRRRIHFQHCKSTWGIELERSKLQACYFSQGDPELLVLVWVEQRCRGHIRETGWIFYIHGGYLCWSMTSPTLLWKVWKKCYDFSARN
jgi:hypothetical protein